MVASKLFSELSNLSADESNNPGSGSLGVKSRFLITSSVPNSNAVLSPARIIAINEIKENCIVSIEEIVVAEEKVVFKIPKELN